MRPIPDSIDRPVAARVAPASERRQRWRRRMARAGAAAIAAMVVCVCAALAGAGSPAAARVTPAGGGPQAYRILIEKQAHRMTLLDRGGAVLRTYRVALGSGGIERKLRQGDARVPEGLYRIDSRNAHSAYHLALHVSFPNAADVARARAAKVAPGGDIMIHGLPAKFAWVGSAHVLHDWTLGCIAVTNAEIEEVWRLVPDGCAVEIRP